MLDNFDIYRKDYFSFFEVQQQQQSTPSKKRQQIQKSSSSPILPSFLSFLPVSTINRTLVRKNPNVCYYTPIISEELRIYLNLVNGVDMELTLRRADLKDKLKILQNPPVGDMVTEMCCKGLPASIAKEVHSHNYIFFVLCLLLLLFIYIIKF